MRERAERAHETAKQLQVAELAAASKLQALEKAKDQHLADLKRTAASKADAKALRYAKAHYVKSEVGRECPRGWFPLMDHGECKLAARVLGGHDETDLGRAWKDHPGGCYIHMGNGHINFNTNSEGGLNPSDERVCKKPHASHGEVLSQAKLEKVSEDRFVSDRYHAGQASSAQSGTRAATDLGPTFHEEETSQRKADEEALTAATAQAAAREEAEHAAELVANFHMRPQEPTLVSTPTQILPSPQGSPLVLGDGHMQDTRNLHQRMEDKGFQFLSEVDASNRTVGGAAVTGSSVTPTLTEREIQELTAPTSIAGYTMKGVKDASRRASQEAQAVLQSERAATIKGHADSVTNEAEAADKEKARILASLSDDDDEPVRLFQREVEVEAADTLAQAGVDSGLHTRAHQVMEESTDADKAKTEAERRLIDAHKDKERSQNVADKQRWEAEQRHDRINAKEALDARHRSELKAQEQIRQELRAFKEEERELKQHSRNDIRSDTYGQAHYTKSAVGQDCPRGWSVILDRDTCKMAADAVGGISKIDFGHTGNNHATGCFMSTFNRHVNFNEAGDNNLNPDDERVCERASEM